MRLTDNRQLYRGLVCLALATLGLSFYFYGYVDTWRLWKIQTRLPPFLDLRLIPGSAESVRAGFDPALENPFDPHGRLFNYPRVWYLILHSKIELTWTVPVAVVLIGVFFVSAASFSGRLDRCSVWLLLVTLFSPSVLLGVERGNVDLLFFATLTLALLVGEVSLAWSLGILTFSVVFKLFPILGAGYLLGLDKRRGLGYFAAALAIALAYFLLTAQDMRHVYSTTMKGSDSSYGVAVLRGYVRRRLHVSADVANRGLYIGAGGLMLVAAIAGILQRGRLSSGNDRNLRGFWMGAGIYAGTFLIGNNWDYRLMFLLFTVPQLVEWARQKGLPAAAAKVSIVATLLSCWYAVIAAYAFEVGYRRASFLVNEGAGWALFATLVYLYVSSLPAWLHEDFASVLGGRRRHQVTP